MFFYILAAGPIYLALRGGGSNKLIVNMQALKPSQSATTHTEKSDHKFAIPEALFENFFPNIQIVTLEKKKQC